jgi:hypothetical protein
VDPFLRLVRSLTASRVRFVLIGLSGINLYARSASDLFATQDRDLFLPPDADDVLAAWQACEALGLELLCAGEQLDRPRDRRLAERVVANRVLVRATDGAGLDADLTLVMAGFEFETVWRERRTFRVDDVGIPVARLSHMVQSKRRAGRAKDHLFFAAHADAIRDLLDAERRRDPLERTPRQRDRGRRPGKRGPRR